MADQILTETGKIFYVICKIAPDEIEASGEIFRDDKNDRYSASDRNYNLEFLRQRLKVQLGQKIAQVKKLRDPRGRESLQFICWVD